MLNGGLDSNGRCEATGAALQDLDGALQMNDVVGKIPLIGCLQHFVGGSMQRRADRMIAIDSELLVTHAYPLLPSVLVNKEESADGFPAVNPQSFAAILVGR